MEEFKYRDYREYLMKEPLRAITIGHVEVNKEKRIKSRKRIKKVQKAVNNRLKTIRTDVKNK